MYIANNDLNLSGLKKQSEKEPTTVLENLTQDSRVEQDTESTNQKSLEEVRSSDTVRELFEKQNESNVVNEHHHDKGTNETQMNTEGLRNDEFYTSGLPLFTKEVLPKIRERMKKNEEFYNMSENKERVGEGDVVSASAKKVEVAKTSGAKSVKVVKAQYAAEALPTEQPSELTMTNTPIEEVQQPVQQQVQQPAEQASEQQHAEDVQQENSDAPKKHSLKYWNHVTKEWKTIAEHDDSDELERLKEEAIKQYYDGSDFEGKNAPFEIFVNEHVKR